MKKTNIVLKVVPLSDYMLYIKYSNNEERMYDFKKSPLWGLGEFVKIQDPKEFCKVRPVFNTVEWDCGVDISPEELYESSCPCDLSGGIGEVALSAED